MGKADVSWTSFISICGCTLLICSSLFHFSSLVVVTVVATKSALLMNLIQHNESLSQRLPHVEQPITQEKPVRHLIAIPNIAECSSQIDYRFIHLPFLPYSSLPKYDFKSALFQFPAPATVATAAAEAAPLLRTSNIVR